jgi:hypothetical protein
MEELADLDADALLAFAESTLHRRRQLEVDDLAAGAHWAVLHALDPTVEDPSGVRRRGGPKLVQIGGEGTPKVQDLCLAELALSRQTHALATRWLVADALDLIHRLPRCWAVVVALECEVWVARKLASATRHLSAAEAAHVDAAVATALAGEQPGRFFTILEAKVIEANPELHAERISAERARRYVSLGRVDAAGLRHVIARVEHGDAVWVDALIGRIAEILAAREAAAGEPVRDRDMLSSVAFGWLARPAELLALLLEHAGDPDSTPEPHPDDTGASPPPAADGTPPRGPDPDPDPDPGSDWVRGFPQRLLGALRSIRPEKLRPRAVVYVHLHQAALEAHASGSQASGVARVEDGGGPRLYQHLADLLGSAQVTVTPVIDLHDRVSTNAYEFPEAVRERIHLMTPAEPFPHSTRTSRTGDMDHVVPYESSPLPSTQQEQTGTHNGAPLGRYAHRVKTHQQYTVREPRPGTFAWRTPHDRYFLVDHDGTRRINESLGCALISSNALDRSLALLLVDTIPGYGAWCEPGTEADPARHIYDVDLDEELDETEPIPLPPVLTSRSGTGPVTWTSDRA